MAAKWRNTGVCLRVEFGTTQHRRPFSLQVAPETTTVVLAIRVWANTITATPGMSANAILIGDAAAIQKEQKLIQAQNVYDYSPLAIDGAVTFLFGVLLLMLYLAQRDHLEYLWLGASNVVGAFAGGLGLIQGAGFLPVSWQYRVGIPLQVIAGVLQIEFLFSFVGVKPNRWVRGFQAFILLFGFSFIVTYGYMNPAVNAFTQGIVAILIGSTWPSIRLAAYSSGLFAATAKQGCC